MVGFGGKQAWLAVRDGDPEQILKALGLRDLGEVRWRDGIDLAHLTDNRLAVTPLLPGARDTRWVLVVGRYLLRPDVVTDITALSGRSAPRCSSSPPTGSPRCIAGSAPRTASWPGLSGMSGRPAK